MQPAVNPKILGYLLELNRLREWEAVHGVPLLHASLMRCVQWPGRMNNTRALNKAYQAYVQMRMSCELMVQEVSRDGTKATPERLKHIDESLVRLAKALEALQAAAMAASESFYAWAQAQAKDVADKDFGNQLRSAHEAIVAAKAVNYGSGAIATAVAAVLGGPVGALVVGTVASVAAIVADKVAKSSAISKALKDPDKVADLAGRKVVVGKATERGEKAGDYTGLGTEVVVLVGNSLGVAAEGGAVALQAATAGTAGLGSVLGPMAFLSDISASTRAAAVPVEETQRLAISQAVRLTWQECTGVNVEPKRFTYLGFMGGMYYLQVDNDRFYMDNDGWVIPEAALMARQAFLRASVLPADPPTVVVDWQSMQYVTRNDHIEHCFIFAGTATRKGAPLKVECCIDHAGNWFIGEPGADQLLASSSRPRLPGASLLLGCADLTAAMDQGLLLTCMKQLAGGKKYRLDEKDLEFDLLDEDEKAHTRDLVNKHNANA
jgi:hypothetical protein